MILDKIPIKEPYIQHSTTTLSKSHGLKGLKLLNNDEH